MSERPSCNTCEWHLSGWCTLYHHPAPIARARPLLCGEDGGGHYPDAKSRPVRWADSWPALLVIGLIVLIVGFLDEILPRL